MYFKEFELLFCFFFLSKIIKCHFKLIKWKFFNCRGFYLCFNLEFYIQIIASKIPKKQIPVFLWTWGFLTHEDANVLLLWKSWLTGLIHRKHSLNSSYWWLKVTDGTPEHIHSDLFWSIWAGSKQTSLWQGDCESPTNTAPYNQEGTPNPQFLLRSKGSLPAVLSPGSVACSR